jgi:alkylhydroperoxidase family enzyme
VLTKQVLDDYKSAPISAPLRATLAFLEKMTLGHESLSVEDVRTVFSAGVTHTQLRDALYVAFLFNIYDRLADTLGWELLDDAGYRAGADTLLKRGYLSNSASSRRDRRNQV